MSGRVLILGATSGIGQAIARRMAEKGSDLVLAARDVEELERTAADLRVRFGIDVSARQFDALDFAGHPAFFDACVGETDQGLEGVILTYGYMVAQDQAEADFDQARRTIDVNFTSCVSILNLAARYLESRGSESGDSVSKSSVSKGGVSKGGGSKDRGSKGRGYICVVSSVAGDRGRQSNYIYGSSKAGLSAYLEGLRNQLHPFGVHVVTIKPGFVDTAMTYGLGNMPMLASAEKVASDILRAIRRRRNVVYTPWFWRWIMFVIRGIPEWLFKRLKL